MIISRLIKNNSIFSQHIRKWQFIFVWFLMTTDWNASSISCGKTWNFKWERMPLFRCQSRVFRKATFKKYGLWNFLIRNIHLCILSTTISMDYDKTWTYVFLFLFLSVVSQNSIITLMKKLFSSSWMKLNLSFFLSLFIDELWWLLAGRWFEN